MKSSCPTLVHQSLDPKSEVSTYMRYLRYVQESVEVIFIQYVFCIGLQSNINIGH